MIPFFQRLSSRLALKAALLAVALGMAFSAFQVYVDYFNEIKKFDASIEHILDAVRKPATQAAYNLDEALAAQVIESLMNYPAIQSVRLLDITEDTDSQLLGGTSREPVVSSWRWLSSLLFGSTRVYSIILEMEEAQEMNFYGRLVVNIDTHLLAENFLNRSSMVIVGGLLRNLTLAALLLWLFHALVNKPLSGMAEALNIINPDKPGKACLICPQHHNKDELGEVVRSTNQLLRSIEQQNEEREQILRQLAEAAMENARLYQLASVDSLTGLYMRRYFELRYSEELKRLQSQHGYLSLLMIDIDHFKQINDQYGHPQGDAVLKEVARLLQVACRASSDVIARYGGEEFIILLPNTSQPGAQRLAERVREDCAKHRFSRLQSEQSLRLTLSIGGASAPAIALDDGEQLIHLADEMLYRAKHGGRNQVCMAAADSLNT